MRILNIRPPAHQGGGNLFCVAKFDAEISPEIRVRDCALMRSRRDGAYIAYGPRNSGGRCVTFSHRILDELAAAALDAYEGQAHVG